MLAAGCTCCLRMCSPSNSNGPTIPCSWLASSPVLCWVGIACPPPGLVFLFLPSPTKDKLFSQFSPTFPLKDGEPNVRSPALPSQTPLSLHTAIALSAQMLQAQAFRAFCALSVFPAHPASLSEEAALAVAQCALEPLDTLWDR